MLLHRQRRELPFVKEFVAASNEIPSQSVGRLAANAARSQRKNSQFELMLKGLQGLFLHSAAAEILLPAAVVGFSVLARQFSTLAAAPGSPESSLAKARGPLASLVAAGGADNHRSPPSNQINPSCSDQQTDDSPFEIKVTFTAAVSPSLSPSVCLSLLVAVSSAVFDQSRWRRAETPKGFPALRWKLCLPSSEEASRI